MRIVELTNKLTIPLTNEESDLLNAFEDSDTLYKSRLNPREQMLVNQLVVKEVLQRVNSDGEIVYKKRIKK